MGQQVYEDMLGQDGSDENPGGTADTVYFSPKSDFDTIQPVPAFDPTAALGTNIKITADHVWLSGKKPYKMEMLQDTGKALADMVGEIGGKSVSSSFECKYVGSLDKVLDMQRRIKNDTFIFFIVLADGKVIQIGTSLRAARAEAGADMATAKEGVRAMTVKVEATSQAAWLYEGDIPEVPAL